MILFPNAKINIGLNVTRRRDDGYHDLSTLFYPIGWCDVLEIVPSKSGETTLTVSGRAVDCPPEKNLVMKAYRAMAGVADVPAVDIFLHKIIPDGAGLGGGSSDAAFLLKGLNGMFSLSLADEELAGLAVTIGADCPFFIYDRPMMASGIGDILTPFDIALAGRAIAVVKPEEYVSTKEAYSGVTPAVPDLALEGILSDSVESWRGRAVNDFERSIFPLHPAIGEVKDRLYELGAVYASMSGSGASVYGIFDCCDADNLSAMIRREFPRMSVWCGLAGY